MRRLCAWLQTQTSRACTDNVRRRASSCEMRDNLDRGLGLSQGGQGRAIGRRTRLCFATSERCYGNDDSYDDVFTALLTQARCSGSTSVHSATWRMCHINAKQPSIPCSWTQGDSQGARFTSCPHSPSLAHKASAKNQDGASLLCYGMIHGNSTTSYCTTLLHARKCCDPRRVLLRPTAVRHTALHDSNSCPHESYSSSPAG